MQPQNTHEPTPTEEEAGSVNRIESQPLRCTAHPHYLPLRRLPSTNEFVLWTAEAINFNHGHDSWFIHLPSRLGHVPVVDACTRALVTASHYRRGTSGVTVRSCYEKLGEALQAMRRYLSGPTSARHMDNTLASIAMLAIHDGVFGTQNFVTWSHIRAFELVLSSRRNDTAISELTCQILEYHCCDASNYACVRGIASPLEIILRAAYTVGGTGTREEAQPALKRMGHILSITIPRLVALTRAAAAFSGSSLEKAMLLATELLLLVDPAAEEELLHKIAVGKSPEQAPETIEGVRFHFDSIMDFDSAVYYWQARGALLRLCHRLPRFQLIPPTNIISLPEDLNHTIIQQELHRLGLSLMLCSEYALSLRNQARKRLFAHAMVTLWGALNDFGGMGAEEDGIRAEILSNINTALAPAVPLTAHDLDEAAEMFVGGPIQGHYARLYGLPLT